MNRPLYHAAFAAGLAVLGWIGYGYLGAAHPLALGMTAVVAAFYLMGAIELHRFGQASASLDAALADIPTPLPALGPWLGRLHPSLRTAVRLRVQGERIALPGPGLTPYLAGLLVLLGMLGTFLGMVATLNGTGAALDSATDVQAVRATLAAPVRGLGLAFGTSVAGIAASAMLGLMSALRRRERLRGAQALDAAIATTLRAFSPAQQRDEAFLLLQQQAGFMQQQASLMPALVDKLQALMDRLEQQGAALGTQLTDSQATFHREAHTAYTGLAASVDRTLQTSLADSARQAGEQLRPVVEATMAHITRETASLHLAVAGAAQRQLDGLAQRLEATTASLATSFATTFEQQATGLVEQVGTAHARLRNELAAQDTQRLQAWQQSLATMADTLQQQWQSGHAGTLAEITRLLQAAGEAPRVAAEVIAEMRQKVSDSVARDTAALDERNRLMETLGTLLDAVNRASHEQRGAIDALIESTTRVLDRVGTQFTDRAAAETDKLAAVAAQVTGSAVEVASLGDAFGVAVQLFSQSSDKLMAQLARVEASLTQSIGRSDEQLAYYVAQARELIDLSVMSQKQIIDDLQQLANNNRRALVVTEAA